MFRPIPKIYAAPLMALLLCVIVRPGLAAPPDTKEHQLMDAIWHGEAATAAILIKQGVNVNVVEDRELNKGMTPLMEVAYVGQTQVARMLIDAGAKINIRDRTKYSVGMTALAWSVIGMGPNKPEATALLLLHGADAEAKDEYERTALMYAGAEGSPACVLALLKGGVKMDTIYGGDTPLTYTAMAGRFDNVTVLVHHGAGVNQTRSDKWTPLMCVIGADPGHQDPKGFALQQAEAVKVLLNAGADVKAANDKSRTALSYATEGHLAAVVDLLRKAGAKN